VRRIRLTTPRGWNLRDDDEEGVEDEDDTDLARPDRRVRRRKWRQDVLKQRGADGQEHDVGGDQDEEDSISSNRSETPCPTVARRCSIREATIRDRYEHDQRVGSAGDGVEEEKRLEHAEVLDGSDDEAGDRRAAAYAEVARNSAKREQGGALLRCDPGEAQNSVRGVRDSEPGAGDGRADEGLPGTVDECEARVTESAREAAGDQDRLRPETIEQRTRRGIATAAVPITAASTSPAVAVGKPRAWCR
jgi:hypothetical protein